MSANKRDMKARLLEWLQHQVDRLAMFSYDIYADDCYDQGLAPMTRQEFTYWMWFFNDTCRIQGNIYNRPGLFEWEVVKVTFRDWTGAYTAYDWEIIHDE